jgi:hypothetical protein
VLGIREVVSLPSEFVSVLTTEPNEPIQVSSEILLDSADSFGLSTSQLLDLLEVLRLAQVKSILSEELLIGN